MYGFTAELALMGLVRWDSTPKGNTGSVERDVVKDVELKTGSVDENNARFANEDQKRLMAEGNGGMWDTTGYTVHSDLMLSVFMEINTILPYQRFAAMLALIWVHPEWVERELMLNSKHSTDYQEVIGDGEEPYTGSVASDVLAEMVDIQHKGFTVYLYQKQEYIDLDIDIQEQICQSW